MSTVRLEYSTNGFADELQVYPVLGPQGQSEANPPAGNSGHEQTFTWKVPNNISDNVKIRITNNTDSAVKDISPQFKIAGRFKLLSPNGGSGVYYEVDGTTAITWEKHGTISQAKLEYSTNGFLNETQTTTITTVNAADLSYDWQIPDAIGNTVKVRISDPAPGNSTISDISDDNFEIRGKIDINSPVGGEIWLIGSVHPIQFTKHGTIPTVKIEYSIAGGPYQYCLDDTLPIGNPASSVSGTSFNWRIPDAKILNGARVKVTNLSDPNNVYTITLPFTIRAGFEWENPNTAGQVFKVGETVVLRWNTFGTVNNVDIEYSTNNGFTWQPVRDIGNNPATGIINNGTFNWPIPNEISKDVYVRIKDSTDQDAVATSPKIKIAGTIFVDEPTSSSRWGVGTNQKIKWHLLGSIANVKLEYSINGGQSWVTPAIADSVIASLGEKDWLIPATVTPNAVVRISDVITDSGTEPALSSTFKIVGSFSFVAPTSTTIWKVTQGEINNPQQNIIWGTQGVVPSVNLYYSKTGTAPWTLINTQGPIPDGGLGGSYSWTVPDAVANTVKIRIEDSADPETFLESEPFTIVGDLKLTSPAGGEKWTVGGTAKPITWLRNSSSIQNVYLEYFDGTIWHYIPDPTDPTGQDLEIPNTGTFAWNVPDTLTDVAKVRITAVGYPAVTDTLAGTFKIIPGFTVTYPNGGESLKVASSTTITWSCTSSQVPNVRIDYSIDGGQTYPYNIKLSTPNDGSESWTVPPTVSKNAKIRVMPATDNPSSPDSFDESNYDFFIRADFTIIEPNGRQSGDPDYPQDLVVGRKNNITWIALGDLANVKLEYSRDPTGNFNADRHTIGVVPNTGLFEWIIPDSFDAGGGEYVNIISNTVKVRISDPNDAEANDVSDHFFRIITGFTVNSHNGPSDVWEVNSDQNITWTCTSNIAYVPQVKIEYSTNSGASYLPLTITDNDGLYTWRVTDNVTSEFKIRVSDLADSRANDESDANAKIIPKFTILTPNGGPTEELTVGDNYEITWSYVGTVDSIKLEYSVDDFVTPVTIVESTANDGSHIWKVPNVPTDTAKVRISFSNPYAYDTSDSTFKIVRGILNLISPNGNERWVTRESRQIIWETTSGSIPKVNIEYSKDNFVNDIHTIVSDYTNTTSPNSFVWEIPDDRSSTVKVRVSDVRDVTVNDISQGYFTIDYYTINWQVRDLLTNEHLSQLVVSATSDKGDEWKTASMPNNPSAPLGSPVSVELPYGFWTALWTKTGYGDKQYSFMCDRDQDLEPIFMETTAIHIWRAYSDFAYEPDNPKTPERDDKLSVSSWLERDGFVVSGGIRADVYIYDPQTGLLVQQLTDTQPDTAGFFHSEWIPTDLQAGKVYTVVTDIENASHAHFKTPDSFSITEAQKLQEVQDTVNSVLDKPISEVNQELQETLAIQTTLIDTKLNDQRLLIEQKMNEQKAIIEQKTSEMITAVNDTLTSFENRTNEAISRLQEGAETAVAAGQALEATAKRYSWNAVVSPDPALSNDIVTITCQGPEDLHPVLDIYSWDNKVIVDDVMLSDDKVKGVYTYEFRADERFTPGKAYTFIITEKDVTGGMVSGSGMVESMGITTVAGLAAAAPEAERAAKKALDAIKAVEAVLISGDNINIALTLKNLKESVDELPEVLSREGPSAKIVQTINQISDWFKTFFAGEGYDFGELFEETLSQSPTLKEVRAKTDTISQIIDILLQLFENKFGGMDSPIISTSLQPGSVKFRIVAFNPSKVRTQRVQVKNYLPQEVKQKDILDLGGLELEYDSQKSMYYVFKPDVELLPGQMQVFEVEVEDIWIISDEVLGDLRTRTDAILNKLKDTEYHQKAQDIANTIYLRLEEIAKTQTDDTVSREQHIGIYRQNILTVERIKEDIAKMEKILATAGGPAAPEMLAKTKIKGELPTKTMTWILIFVIIIFIGLLATVLFFTWHRQSRITKEELLAAKKSAFGTAQTDKKE
ncbi:MAG: hypothetical protein NC908_01395 [Candidatus Omnitrophica bacterium]|nr:hypothetical protein [Candidatus Omnitrophota bacterium]